CSESQTAPAGASRKARAVGRAGSTGPSHFGGSGMAKTGRALLVVIVLGTTTAYGAEPLGFGGVSLGATETELRSVFPDVECRGDRCFVKALAWGGVPTTAWFIFGDDTDGSIKAIALAFKS